MRRGVCSLLSESQSEKGVRNLCKKERCSTMKS